MKGSDVLIRRGDEALEISKEVVASAVRHPKRIWRGFVKVHRLVRGHSVEARTMKAKILVPPMRLQLPDGRRELCQTELAVEAAGQSLRLRLADLVRILDLDHVERRAELVLH